MHTDQARKLIAVDCDGTLFGKDGFPSRRTCEVLQRVVDAGHHIVAATGRSRLTACDRLADVDGLRYLICSNGAYCWDRQEDQLVWETPLAQAAVARIAASLRGEFADVAFAWETRTGIGFENAFVELAGGLAELETGGHAGDPWSQDIYKLKARRPGASPIEFLQQMSLLPGSELCEATTSGAPFVEITALESNKATGLSRTADTLGFTAQETIVFGDNHNDLPMFAWAGHAVAMANALDVVQAQAHSVTLSNVEHGVAHYLERLLDEGLL